MDAQPHTPNRTLANRRALGAAIGSLVGVVGWQLGEYGRYPGEYALISGETADVAIQVVSLLTPIASAALYCRLIVLR